MIGRLGCPHPPRNARLGAGTYYGNSGAYYGTGTGMYGSSTANSGNYYDTPTDLDSYYDTASSTVQNLWNDAESFIQHPIQSLNSVLEIPGNPAAAGAAAAQNDTGPLSAIADALCLPNANNPNTLSSYCYKTNWEKWLIYGALFLVGLVVLDKEL